MLETALTVPVFIVLLSITVSCITLVNADLYLQRATENVVSEVNIAIPFASGGIQCLDEVVSALGIGDVTSTDTEEIDEILGILGIASGLTGIDLEDVLCTTAFGRYMKDRIVIEYQKLVNDRWVYSGMISDVSVYLDYCSEDVCVYVYVFYEYSLGDISIEKTYCSSLALYAEKIPLGKGPGKTNEKEDSVWDKDNFERGTALREIYGGNVPYNYPVISKFDNGEATSIKSIDTTSPYYGSNSKLEGKIKGYIRDLSEFDGAVYGGLIVRSDEIRSKKLLVIVPKNGESDRSATILGLEGYAKSYGVELILEEYGESYKYI
ncbi:MAG: hypothetical protein J5379_10555 [Clostridiales bacterium]|nr:hypothetical protein [Clostridiales bacterium]